MLPNVTWLIKGRVKEGRVRLELILSMDSGRERQQGKQ